MNFDEVLTETKAIDQRKQDLVKEIKPMIKGIFLPVLEKWPKLTGFRWVQYTPYYNDGEPCVFGVHELYAIWKDMGEEDGEMWWLGHEKSGLKTTEFGDKAQEFKEDMHELSEAFKIIPEWLMEGAFGDHCEVHISRTRITVAEYEHD